MRLLDGGDLTVLQLGPALTVAEVPAICRVINRLAAKGGERLVIDLSGVTAIDPLGVLGLLGWRQQLVASGGELAIYRPKPEIAAALDLFYVSRQLTMTDELPPPARLAPHTFSSDGGELP